MTSVNEILCKFVRISLAYKKQQTLQVTLNNGHLIETFGFSALTLRLR